MLEAVRNAFRLPDLRQKLFVTFSLLAFYRLAANIPLTCVDHQALSSIFQQNDNILLNFLNFFSGGGLARMGVMALGVYPYITASIILQLLIPIIPALEELSKEGEGGRAKINQYTLWMTIPLAILQAIAQGTLLSSNAVGNIPVLPNWGFSPGDLMSTVTIIVGMTAGTMLGVWIGQLITEQGIGNGVSIIIFTGIVAFLPSQIVQTIKVESANSRWWALALLGILFVITVAFVVAITQAQRKIPIQHVKRIVGNKMVGGSSSFLPLKINSAGVIPIIFAISIAMFPMTLVNLFTHGAQQAQNTWYFKLASGIMPGTTWWGSLGYALLIVFFTYFYTAVTFNVKEVSDNLKKWGSFIPGIRPGKPTQEYLDKIMTRITLAGGLFLAIIALTQYVIPAWLRINTFSLIGGTSLLIVVGVALETMQAIESHLLMRHYEGFIK